MADGLTGPVKHSSAVKPALPMGVIASYLIDISAQGLYWYYIRRSRGSNKWVVFLEGGWYCFDHVSCSERSRVMPDFMSSRNWPRFRSAMKFSFMGSLILDEVFNELLQKGMRRAQTVLIAGTSAGATGVLVNIDRIADLIHARKPSVDVRGLVDSGWFLDIQPFKEKVCRDAFTCSPLAGIQRGVQVWNPRLPKGCIDAHPDEIWRCYFGRRVFPSIQTPVYIIQNMYDAAQIQVSNVLEEQHTWPRGELSSDQWRYLLDLGQQVKDTLQNVSAVFAPGCVSHEILNKPSSIVVVVVVVVVVVLVVLVVVVKK
ncbi:palmitoleoyl-protein carboxylesterase NOTUM [Elysia marginata]|uniref:Palmitoleoyl-protein carboxylesterase NOTUM n=1 Tax=Elysia marginata TaxID=1093978 RepID=A0AAV4ETX1_9GAST|nr:palmitoleoyl-protein carboxylesterase NOTUM [Elysia marginata]